MDVIELAIQLGILFQQNPGKDSYAINRQIEDLLEAFAEENRLKGYDQCDTDRDESDYWNSMGENV